MGTERVLAESTLSCGTKVITTDRITPESITGVHATCSTFVSDAYGIFPREPVATYLNTHAAKIGHDIVIERMERQRIESRLIHAGGHRSLAGGAL